MEERAVLFWRKWVGFVAAIWLMSFSATYPFSNYSQALKEVLNINQQRLNLISILRDLGDAWGGILAGFLSNYLPPWALLCFSASCSALGYGVQWLVVSQTISPLPFWTIALAATAAGTSIAWINSAVFNASVRNFTRNKGPVAGLFKALMGLSGAVFSTLCEILFSSSASMFLLMLTTIPATFCIISAIFFRPVPTASTDEDEQMERKSLTMYNVIACTLAVYIAVLGFVPDDLQSMSMYKPASVFIMAAIIASPVFVPIFLFTRMKIESSSERSVLEVEIDQERGIPVSAEKQWEKDTIDHDSEVVNTFLQNEAEKNQLSMPLLENNTVTESFHKKLGWGICCGHMQCFSTVWTPDELGEDTSSLSLFKKWHFYVLFGSLVCGGGSAVSFSNNLGQIGQSFGFDSVSVFISFFSLGNFAGRLAAGIVSESFIRLAGIPRPVWMGVAKVPMIVMSLWLSMGSKASLYVGSLVLGISHGSLITLSIPIVSEFYGLKHFGTNLMVLSLYFVVGSYSFSSVAGWLYDSRAELVYGEDGASSLTCYGSQCYGSTFLIFAACLTCALAMDTVLSLLSKPLYKRMKDDHAHLAES